MGKILIENQCMTIRDQKLGQEEAPAVQFYPNFSFNWGGFVRTAHAYRERGFGRLTNLFYTNTPHQFQDAYRNPLSMLSYNNTYALRLNALLRPQPLYRPVATPTPSLQAPGSFRGPHPHFTQIVPGQNATYSFPRPPLICYSCRQEEHISRNCFNSHSINFI